MNLLLLQSQDPMYVLLHVNTCTLYNYFKLSLLSAENILADIAVFLTLSTQEVDAYIE